MLHVAHMLAVPWGRQVPVMLSTCLCQLVGAPVACVAGLCGIHAGKISCLYPHQQPMARETVLPQTKRS